MEYENHIGLKIVTFGLNFMMKTIVELNISSYSVYDYFHLFSFTVSDVFVFVHAHDKVHGIGKHC